MTDTKLYNPHEGLRPRIGGPFLDQLELEAAEVRRAKAEGREPDFKNLQGTPGVILVPAEKLIEKVHNWIPAVEMIEALADNPDVGPNPVGVQKEPVVEKVGKK